MTPVETDRRSSRPTEIRIAEAKAGLASRIVAGSFFMLAGAAVFAWGVHADNHYLMAGGAGSSVFGAMILPDVFESVKPALVFFFPNGIPFLGGRRKDDPQPQAFHSETPPTPKGE